MNSAFDNNNSEGWSGTTPGFQTYSNAEFYNCNYDFHQTIAGVKKGVYKVEVTAYYRHGNAVSDAEAYTKYIDEGISSEQYAKLYATTSVLEAYDKSLPFATSGASTESITTDEASNSYGFIPNAMKSAAYYMSQGKYEPTSLITAVEDGNITIGLKKETHIGDDWTLFDDWKLYYLGDSEEAYKYMAEEYLSGAVDYVDYLERNEDVYYNKAAYDAYVEAQSNLANANTADDIRVAISAYDVATKKLESSIDAYSEYYTKYVEVETFLEERGDAFFGTGTEVLYDYVSIEEEPSELFPNGTAQYILYYGKLTNEQIAAEVKFLDKLLADAIATGMSDGTDCTELLKTDGLSNQA